MDICIFTNLDFGNAVVKVLCRVHLEAAVLTYDHGEEEGAFVYISPYNIQALMRSGSTSLAVKTRTRATTVLTLDVTGAPSNCRAPFEISVSC